ncbi:MAG: hypothetical protein K5787_15780 [Lentisphaeria bacterium]|nr:hypothetical protein [Lentisphaeria bacterium]
MKLYIKNNGKILGPLDWDRILALHDKGRFSSDATVSEDKANWLTIEQVMQLTGQNSGTSGNNSSLSTIHNQLPQASLRLQQEENLQEGYAPPMQPNMQQFQQLGNLTTQQPNTQQAMQVGYMAPNQPDIQQPQQAGAQQKNSNNNKIYLPVYLLFISLIVVMCLFGFISIHKNDSKKGKNSSTTELSTPQVDKTEEAPSLPSVSTDLNGDDENTEEKDQMQIAAPQEGSQIDEKEIQDFEDVTTAPNRKKGNQQEGTQEKGKASQSIQGEIQIDELLSFPDDPPAPNGNNGNHERNNQKPDNEFPDAQGGNQTGVPQRPGNTPAGYPLPIRRPNSGIQQRYPQQPVAPVARKDRQEDDGIPKGNIKNKGKTNDGIPKVQKSKKRNSGNSKGGRNKATNGDSSYLHLPSAREQTSPLKLNNSIIEETGRNKLTEGKNRNKIIKTTY